MITWTLLISLIVGYIAILSITTLLAQPVRLRLVALVDEMLDESGWNKSERSMLEFLAEACSSSAVGLLVPFASAYGLATAVLGGRDEIDPKLARLEGDPRHTKLVVLFMVSIAGNSPFAVLFAVPLMALATAARVLRGEKSLAQAVDAPIRRVSSTFQTC
jgi:hypothetical protein